MPFSRPDPFLPGTHRALVVLRFLLNTTEETDCFLQNPTTLCYPINYIRSAETGEIFGLGLLESTLKEGGELVEQLFGPVADYDKAEF